MSNIKGESGVLYGMIGNSLDERAKRLKCKYKSRLFFDEGQPDLVKIWYNGLYEHKKLWRRL